MRGHGDPLRYAPRIFGINHLEDETGTEKDLFLRDFYGMFYAAREKKGGHSPETGANRKCFAQTLLKPPLPPRVLAVRASLLAHRATPSYGTRLVDHSCLLTRAHDQTCALDIG